MQNTINHTVMSTIRGNYMKLSMSEKLVADYVILNADNVVNFSIIELADNTNVSHATVLRFVRNIGYEGFNEFKLALAVELSQPTEAVFEAVSPTDTTSTIIEKVFQLNIQQLEDTLNIVNSEAIEKALLWIKQAKKIYIYAVGTSAPLADYLYERLFRLQFNAVSITDAYLQIIQSSIIKEEELLIVISRTGTPQTLVNAINNAKANGAKSISISCKGNSKVASVADLEISGSVTEIFRDISGSPVTLTTYIDVIHTCLMATDIDKTTKCQKKIWQALNKMHR